MRAASRTLGIMAAMLTLALPARADSIQLTSGALQWVNGGGAASITMAGGGFTFEGSGSPSGGIFTPASQCGVPECTAGGTVDLHSFWSGNDLPGTATLNGTTYNHVGSLSANSSAQAQWTGLLHIPTGFTGGLLTTRFLFSGQFAYEWDPSQPWRQLGLFGSGTASLMFTPYPGQPGAFTLSSLVYEFDAAPVPEPASMFLIGTGLAGLAAMRRRRRLER